MTPVRLNLVFNEYCDSSAASVDSETFDAKNWTCLNAVSPANTGHFSIRVFSSPSLPLIFLPFTTVFCSSIVSASSGTATPFSLVPKTFLLCLLSDDDERDDDDDGDGHDGWKKTVVTGGGGTTTSRTDDDEKEWTFVMGLNKQIDNCNKNIKDDDRSTIDDDENDGSFLQNRW